MALPKLLNEIRSCRLCAESLPEEPRPILQASATARVLVAGQAPGRRAHEARLPFRDVSGDRLRAWMGIDDATFYDAARIAIVPMGFCFPGTGRAGDLPPRPECASAWRDQLLAELPELRLTLVIGAYARAYHLPEERGSLTDTVRAWRKRGTQILALPHPSPRNLRWLRTNPWFEAEVIPVLRRRVRRALATP